MLLYQSHYSVNIYKHNLTFTLDAAFYSVTIVRRYHFACGDYELVNLLTFIIKIIHKSYIDAPFAPLSAATWKSAPPLCRPRPAPGGTSSLSDP